MLAKGDGDKMSMERPIYKKKTYCNPISMPTCPQGYDGAWEDNMEYTMEKEVLITIQSSQSMEGEEATPAELISRGV